MVKMDFPLRFYQFFLKGKIAYLQLQHAIAGVQAILAELEGEAK